MPQVYLQVFLVIIVERCQCEIHKDVHDQQQKQNENQCAPGTVIVSWQPTRSHHRVYIFYRDKHVIMKGARTYMGFKLS